MYPKHPNGMKTHSTVGFNPIPTLSSHEWIILDLNRFFGFIVITISMPLLGCSYFLAIMTDRTVHFTSNHTWTGQIRSDIHTCMSIYDMTLTNLTTEWMNWNKSHKNTDDLPYESAHVWSSWQLHCLLISSPCVWLYFSYLLFLGGVSLFDTFTHNYILSQSNTVTHSSPFPTPNTKSPPVT